MNRRGLIGLGLAVALGVAATGAAAPGTEVIDYSAIDKFKDEGLTAARSKVMEIAWQLTDVQGPRLTGSPNILAAGQWTVNQMKEWGLTDAALDPWPSDTATPNNDGFPRGWTNEKFYMQATAPQAFPIHGTPTAWTPGTKGLAKGEVVLVTETTEAAIRARFPEGALKGKWIITAAAADVQAYWDAKSRRYTTEQLNNMETPPRTNEFGAPVPAPPARVGAPATPVAPAGPTSPARAGTAPATPAAPPPAGRGGRGGGAAQPPAPPAPAAPFNRNNFLKSQGALGVISTNTRGHGVYVIGGVRPDSDPDKTLTAVLIPAEEYNRIARLTARGIPVTLEADIKNVFNPNPPMFNVVGEIRGTDKADEVVMLGGHFDFWHASTGATDNAAGSAVMLEAMRILKASGLPIRRTVRIGLWTGEEQGLYGSRIYVAKTFGGVRPGGAAPAPVPGVTATPTPAAPRTPAHAKFQAYFNVDNGTGAIRGVYLQQNQAIGPIFRQWMEPLRSLGVTHINTGNTTGTDHQSFDGAGLPGFQFIQDPIEYDPLTHHTNFDSYDRLQPEDMRRNAVIVATFVYLAANRDELVPRKPARATPAAPAAPAVPGQPR